MRTTLIRGGSIYDGSGDAPFPGDVLVGDGIIAAVARGGFPGSADVVMDAAGLAVAPGFIDAHSHSEWIVPEKNHLQILKPFLLQGVTAFMGGNCGFSPFPVAEAVRETVLENSRFLVNERFAFHWRDQGGFFRHLEENGVCLNVATLVGHGPLRTLIRGGRPGPLAAGERDRLARMLEEAFNGGAYGVSMGLAFVPGIFADAAEIETVFAAVARAGRIVAVHGRTYSRISPYFPDDVSGAPHNLLDLASFIDVAAKTGAKLHISHLLLKGSGTWDLWRDAIELFERANADGVDVTFGVIPYHCGNTPITTLFPKWFLEDFAGNMARPDRVKRLEREVFDTERAIGRTFSDLHLLWGVNPSLAPLEGKSFSRIAEEMGIAEIEACLYLARESGGGAKVLTAAYSGREGDCPEPLERLLEHPLSLVEIDAVLTSPEGPRVPASFGAFPKWLGHYCRERGLMSMEQGVRKLTGAPADRFGLRNRGYLREGFAADMVLFNPATIRDANSIADPARPAVGVAAVLVNGGLVVANGAVRDPALRGRVLYP
ncbi:MAG: amidohydrolase family protein [Planctomycetota bacterium]|jgi:N-acyl-D-amino-acid deacylase|nr:amidohydrolase family protein [Planctomycetota bacterium]